MVVLGMGGGSLKGAVFNNEPTAENPNAHYGDATFSFFAGFDKRGNLKGSVFFKRLYPGRLYESGRSGTRAVVSTEITALDWGFDDDCPWVRMEGLATFHFTWGSKPVRDHNFAVEVWDCDAVGEGPDVIWFQLRRPDDPGPPVVPGTERPAVTLKNDTELTGGNIMILNEGFPD
jgi:hypothetical protein